MVRIRLQRHGRNKKPYYHIVAADQRAKRDGRIIEDLGRFSPFTEEGVTLKVDRVIYWILNGAQPTDTVRGILKKEGVLMRVHLLRWKKSEEEIAAALAEWKQAKKVEGTVSNTRKAQLDRALQAEEVARKKAIEAAKNAPAPVAAPVEVAPEESAPVEASSAENA